MSEQSNAIAVIGIDIGKNSFHVVGHDRRGAIVPSCRAFWPYALMSCRPACRASSRRWPNARPVVKSAVWALSLPFPLCAGLRIWATSGSRSPTLIDWSYKVAGKMYSFNNTASGKFIPIRRPCIDKHQHVEAWNDDQALACPAHCADPFDHLPAAVRTPKPPMISVQELSRATVPRLAGGAISGSSVCHSRRSGSP